MMYFYNIKPYHELKLCTVLTLGHECGRVEVTGGDDMHMMKQNSCKSSPFDSEVASSFHAYKFICIFVTGTSLLIWQQELKNTDGYIPRYHMLRLYEPSISSEIDAVRYCLPCYYVQITSTHHVLDAAHDIFTMVQSAPYNVRTDPTSSEVSATFDWVYLKPMKFHHSQYIHALTPMQTHTLKFSFYELKSSWNIWDFFSQLGPRSSPSACSV